MTGDVDPDRALRRSGARVGDRVFVTGTVGDAAAGLQLLTRGESDDFLLRRFCGQRRVCTRVCVWQVTQPLRSMYRTVCSAT